MLVSEILKEALISQQTSAGFRLIGSSSYSGKFSLLRVKNTDRKQLSEATEHWQEQPELYNGFCL